MFMDFRLFPQILHACLSLFLNMTNMVLFLGLIKHCLHYMFIQSYAFAKSFHEYNCITSQCNVL